MTSPFFIPLHVTNVASAGLFEFSGLSVSSLTLAGTPFSPPPSPPPSPATPPAQPPAVPIPKSGGGSSGGAIAGGIIGGIAALLIIGMPHFVLPQRRNFKSHFECNLIDNYWWIALATPDAESCVHS